MGLYAPYCMSLGVNQFAGNVYYKIKTSTTLKLLTFAKRIFQPSLKKFLQEWLVVYLNFHIPVVRKTAKVIVARLPFIEKYYCAPVGFRAYPSSGILHAFRYRRQHVAVFESLTELVVKIFY